MSNASISKLNKGVLTPSPPGKKRVQEMLKAMATPQGNSARIHNKLLAQARHEQDLLMRDARRGHHTTRIKRALRRAAKSEPTNESTNQGEIK